MRVAALHDVHGNLPALQAVLADIAHADVDAIVSGGDVLWGPLQAECLGLLVEADALFVRGNCEREVLAPSSETDRWCAAQLTPRDRELVAHWPLTVELDVGGLGRVVFCHATPRDDDEILTRATPDDDMLSALAAVAADVVVCGHVHVQDDRRLDGGPRVVNAGSVGMPCQGAAGAYWVLLGEDVELRRTDYDVAHALEVLDEAGFPSFRETFQDALEGRVSALSATEHFEQKRRGA